MEGEQGSSGNVVVVTDERVRRRSRATSEEIRAAVENRGSGFKEWLFEEGAWLFAQFLRISLSVAVFRGVHQLFRARLADESAYRRAPDLWGHGREEGGNETRSENRATPFRDRAERFDSGPNPTTPENPRYIVSLEGRHLYLHHTLLDPVKQHWPCPLLLKTPCGSCEFLEYDSGGAPQCAAAWKMQSVIRGIDAGESFDDVREWIRTS